MNQHCYCNVLFAQQKCVTMATQFVVNIDSPHLKAIKHSPWRIRFYVLFIFRSSFFALHFSFQRCFSITEMPFLPLHLLSPTMIFQSVKFQETLVIPMDYFAISLYWFNGESPGGKFHVRQEEHSAAMPSSMLCTVVVLWASGETLTHITLTWYSIR